METGYIKLWRSIDQWGWRTNPSAFNVYMYCLTHARHEPGQYQGIDLQPGQLVTGRNAICSGTGLTIQSVRTALKHLKNSGNLTIKSTNKFSIITVVNWAKFQSPTAAPNQQPNQQLTNNQPATNQQLTTNKKEKNERMKEGVVDGTFSEKLFHSIKQAWEKPSEVQIEAIQNMANQHGEATVINAITKALEHDSRGGISVAYVRAIIEGGEKQKPVQQRKPLKIVRAPEGWTG